MGVSLMHKITAAGPAAVSPRGFGEQPAEVHAAEAKAGEPLKTDGAIAGRDPCRPN